MMCVCVCMCYVKSWREDTGAGVIDADYTGEVKVVLFNHSNDDFEGQIDFIDKY